MAEDLGQQLPATRNLHECLSRAEELAARRKHTVVGLDHLLTALAEDPDALGVLLACRVDVEAMCADLLRKLGPEARTLSPNAVPPTQDITVQNLMAHASAAAQKSARTEVDGSNVMTAIISGEGGLITHKILTRHGLTFDEAINNLTKPKKPDAEQAKMSDPAREQPAEFPKGQTPSQDNKPLQDEQNEKRSTKKTAPKLKIAVRQPADAAPIPRDGAARHGESAPDQNQAAGENKQVGTKIEAKITRPQRTPAAREAEQQKAGNAHLVETDGVLAGGDRRYNPLDDGIIETDEPETSNFEQANDGRHLDNKAPENAVVQKKTAKKIPHAFPAKFPGKVKINQIKKSQQRPDFGRRPAPPGKRVEAASPRPATPPVTPPVMPPVTPDGGSRTPQPDHNENSQAKTPRAQDGITAESGPQPPGKPPARPPSPIETDNSRDPATLRSMAPEKAAPPPQPGKHPAIETAAKNPVQTAEGREDHPSDSEPAASPPPHPNETPLSQKAFDEAAFMPPPQNLPPANAAVATPQPDHTPATPDRRIDGQQTGPQPPQWNPADVNPQNVPLQPGLPPHPQLASPQALPPGLKPVHGPVPGQVPEQQVQLPPNSQMMPPFAQPQGHPGPQSPHYPPEGPPPTRGYNPPSPDNTARMDDIAESIRRSQMHLEQHADQDQVIENIPKVMRVGKVHYVEVRVARFTNAELDLDSDNYGLRSKAEKKRITKAITVRLTGPDGLFLIDSATASTQWSELHGATGEDADFAVWRWRVLPRRSGHSKLRLDITVRAAGQNAVSAEIPVQPSKSFEVKITRNYLSLLKRLLIWGTIFALGLGIARYGPTIIDGTKTKVQTLLTEDD